MEIVLGDFEALSIDCRCMELAFDYFPCAQAHIHFLGLRHEIKTSLLELSPYDGQLSDLKFFINIFFCLFQDECQNYVRVMIVYGKKVFTCGTNAFSPVCSSRQVSVRIGQNRMDMVYKETR